MDWSQALSEIRAKKLALARLDPRGGMPVVPPAGASEASIKTIERRLGRRVPPSYRSFLAQHDGFPNLFQAASLLSASNLARGTYVDVARMVLAECEAPSGEASTSPRARAGSALIPFAIDPQAEIVVAWDPAVETRGGELEVVAWVNEVGVRVESFSKLLELILDMISADVDELSSHLAPRSEPRARKPLARPDRARSTPQAASLKRAG